MWLRIGGEPRCIFCQFLFQGFVGLRFCFGRFVEVMSHENVSLLFELPVNITIGLKTLRHHQNLFRSLQKLKIF